MKTEKAYTAGIDVIGGAAGAMPDAALVMVACVVAAALFATLTRNLF